MNKNKTPTHAPNYPEKEKQMLRTIAGDTAQHEAATFNYSSTVQYLDDALAMDIYEGN